MRRWIAACLTVCMVVAAAGAFAETAAQNTAQSAQTTASPAAISALGRPVSSTPTHITVGNATQVSGEFFTDMWGNNTSDMDVRTLLHGYNLVAWSSQVQFVVNPIVVQNMETAAKGSGTVYTVTLQPGLFYCDGKTAITAKDYVFSLLLCTSPQMAQLGADASHYRYLVGYDAYHSGKTKALAGVRLLDDHTFSIAVSKKGVSFFYDMANLSCNPYPRSVLAPGCDVADTKAGATLISTDGQNADAPFTADVLRETILDPKTGYRSHPMLTSGPYQLTAYDAASGRVDFAINPYFVGNYEGVKPVIDTLTLLPAKTDAMIAQLQSGVYDLLNKCVDASVIQAGLSIGGQDILRKNYARLGYGFCSFACEKGPQQFEAVRQAIAYSIDHDTLVKNYLQDFGLPVYGYYGMGQWMTLAALGSLRPETVSGNESGKWDKQTLDKLNHYDLDLNKAKALLVKDGWVWNAKGAKFVEGVDDVRYKKVGKQLMRLSMRFAQTEGNAMAALIVKQLQSVLPEMGFELIAKVVPFSVALADYYRENGTRQFDMGFMATNFLSAFDPYETFSADGRVGGTANYSGLNDQKLANLAQKMRTTKTQNYLAYEQNWVAFQQRYNEVLPSLPLYSNVYFDFHTSWLQNYEPNAYSGWAAAILYAYVGDPALNVQPADGAANTATPADGSTTMQDGADSTDTLIID